MYRLTGLYRLRRFSSSISLQPCLRSSTRSFSLIPLLLQQQGRPYQYPPRGGGRFQNRGPPPSGRGFQSMPPRGGRGRGNGRPFHPPPSSPPSSSTRIKELGISESDRKAVMHLLRLWPERCYSLPLNDLSARLPEEINEKFAELYGGVGAFTRKAQYFFQVTTRNGIRHVGLTPLSLNLKNKKTYQIKLRQEQETAFQQERSGAGGAGGAGPSDGSSKVANSSSGRWERRPPSSSVAPPQR